jgi:hypothetical protein
MLVWVWNLGIKVKHLYFLLDLEYGVEGAYGYTVAGNFSRFDHTRWAEEQPWKQAAVGAWSALLDLFEGRTFARPIPPLGARSRFWSTLKAAASMAENPGIIGCMIYMWEDMVVHD